jgi:hypothetical protein
MAMKLVGNIIMVTVLGTMFLSLFHMSMGMDMHGGMTDCPFVVHDEVICPMDLADHLVAWKSVFTAVSPTLLLLLGLTGFVALVASVAPNLLRKISYASPPIQRWLEVRTYTFSYRPLQELFSNGILHPKLF